MLCEFEVVVSHGILVCRIVVRILRDRGTYRTLSILSLRQKERHDDSYRSSSVPSALRQNDPDLHSVQLLHVAQ